jgi:hypothetical protein
VLLPWGKANPGRFNIYTRRIKFHVLEHIKRRVHVHIGTSQCTSTLVPLSARPHWYLSVYVHIGTPLYTYKRYLSLHVQNGTSLYTYTTVTWRWWQCRHPNSGTRLPDQTVSHPSRQAVKSAYSPQLLWTERSLRNRPSEDPLGTAALETTDEVPSV